MNAVQQVNLHNDSYIAQLDNNSTATIGLQGIFTGLVLGSFTMLTVTGNLLVIYAVLRMRYLRSMTNYFIVSLAVADLLMGSVVMPFAALTEATNYYWPFGQDWCDLWHAFDVLSSTASILNLCMIAVERYWATENPITYPSKMTRKRCLLMVAAVWICSSVISFPAIIWWRAVALPVSDNSTTCDFPNDRSYLFLSSTISFYVPLMVMIFVYWRIFKTANDLVKSLNSGTKVIYTNGTTGEVMTLRIHRGGGAQTGSSTDEAALSKQKPSPGGHSPVHHGKKPGQPKRSSPRLTRGLLALKNANSDYSAARMAQAEQSGLAIPESEPEAKSDNKQCISKKLRSFALGKRLTKFAREQKAAKTLGIVMGIFIICWLPFFTCLIIIAIDKDALGDNVGQIFTVVTWLGYVNSSVNPIIYAHSMRDFRRAFITILCNPCLARQRRLDPFLPSSNHPKQSRSLHTLTSSSTRTFTSRRQHSVLAAGHLANPFSCGGGGGGGASWWCCCLLRRRQSGKRSNSPGGSFSISQTDQELCGLEVEPLPRSGLNLSSPHIAVCDSDSE